MSTQDLGATAASSRTSKSLGKTVTPLGKPKPQMSFPPLVHKWTVKSEASWPGAEYTRRTKLKTRCEEPYNGAFVEEMQSMLGEHKFQHYQEAMQPSVSKRINRGKPPDASLGVLGATQIIPSSKLERRGGDLSATMGSTTTNMQGMTSRSRLLETTKTQWGDVPSHMFDNKPAKPVASLDEWFLTCLLYTSPSPRDGLLSRMPSSA